MPETKRPKAKKRDVVKPSSEYRKEAWRWFAAPETALPDWNDNTENGNAEMLAWLNWKLDKGLDAAMTAAGSEENLKEYEEALKQFAGEREARAERRSRFAPLLELLRTAEAGGVSNRTIAELTAFVEGTGKFHYGNRGRPKRTKEERRNRSSIEIAFASGDADRITALWKKHYGRVRRGAHQVKAVEFAARRWMSDDRRWTSVDALVTSIENLRSRTKDRRLDRD